jgi:CDP-diacylglycerol--glycerol-3-phosphate 3-phosphatidyltransferase
MGLRPGTVTLIGLLLACAVPAVVLAGGFWLFVGAALVLLSALADSSDGAVAIISGRSSRLGAFYDATADRLSELAWLVALGFLGTPWILVAACGALAWLHEYARARAALGGMTGIGAVTVAERPTRVLLVIAALVVGGLGGFVSDRLTAGLITIVVAVWTVLGLLGGSRLLTAIRAALR